MRMWILVAVCGMIASNQLHAEYGHIGGDYGGGRSSSESGYGSPNSNCQPVRPGGGYGQNNSYAAAAPIAPMPVGQTQVVPPPAAQPVTPAAPTAPATPATPAAPAKTEQTAQVDKDGKPIATNPDIDVNKLFQERCLFCHGNNIGPDLTKKTGAVMAESVEAGRMPTAKPGKSVAPLTPEEKVALVAFLKTKP